MNAGSGSSRIDSTSIDAKVSCEGDKVMAAGLFAHLTGDGINSILTINSLSTLGSVRLDTSSIGRAGGFIGSATELANLTVVYPVTP